MPWKVYSSVIGGKRLTAAEEYQYRQFSTRLQTLSSRFMTLSAQWTQASLSITGQSSHVFSQAPTTSIGSANTGLFGQTTLLSAYNPRESQHCLYKAKQCYRIAQQLDTLATLINRANNLYADAEASARQRCDQIIAWSVTLLPHLAIPFFITAGIAGILDATKHTKLTHLAAWSRATSSLQQGVFQGFSRNMLLNPLTGIPMLGLYLSQHVHDMHTIPTPKGIPRYLLDLVSLEHRQPVNAMASSLSALSAPLTNRQQGDRLMLRELRVDAPERYSLMPKSCHSISDALDNLTRLANTQQPGLLPSHMNQNAHTIAIQRIRKADGTNSWVITIPGTDGKAQSPFGWPQNAETMSTSASTRAHADSTRMVIEAMRSSHIQPNEPVVLVGHSQGGIVAATIASDYADRYRIAHVVTAGSPIANHAINKRTWVTSIEMDDELVPTLDGANNPTRSNWVTIRGHAQHVHERLARISQPHPEATRSHDMDKRKQTTKTESFTGVLVEDVDEEGTLTHDLNYHRAAYADASKLSSQAIRAQEQHFADVVNGTLQETRFWQATMY